jgi:hypothetical protein
MLNELKTVLVQGVLILPASDVRDDSRLSKARKIEGFGFAIAYSQRYGLLFFAAFLLLYDDGWWGLVTKVVV